MIRCIAVFAVSLSLISSSVLAQDSPKGKAPKGNPETAMINQFMKQLEAAEAPADLLEKIKEVFSKTVKEVVAKRKEVGLTPAMLQKRAEAGNKAREEGKKPKEVKEIAIAAMNATDDQKKVLAETEEMLAKTRVEIGKLLTDEQKSKLPKPLQANLKEPTSKERAPKKK
jgi:hypothetical protein